MGLERPRGTSSVSSLDGSVLGIAEPDDSREPDRRCLQQDLGLRTAEWAGVNPVRKDGPTVDAHGAKAYVVRIEGDGRETTKGSGRAFGAFRA